MEKTGDITSATPEVGDTARAKCAGNCKEKQAEEIDQEDIMCQLSNKVVHDYIKCCGSKNCKK